MLVDASKISSNPVFILDEIEYNEVSFVGKILYIAIVYFYNGTTLPLISCVGFFTSKTIGSIDG